MPQRHDEYRHSHHSSISGSHIYSRAQAYSNQLPPQRFQGLDMVQAPRQQAITSHRPEFRSVTKDLSYQETASRSSQKQQELGSYINPEILYLAEQLNLPQDGHKFSPKHWKDAMALLYRWKVTDDDIEQERFERSTGTGSSMSYSSSKSVKAFCDKVLCRPSKRRQFSIHWKDSGLKHFADMYDNDEEFPPYNSREFKIILDNFVFNLAQKSAYKAAKQEALAKRQQDINIMWDRLVNGTERLTSVHLQTLQELIERPIVQTVVKEDGKAATPNLVILGFDGCFPAKTAGNKRTCESDELNGTGNKLSQGENKKYRSDNCDGRLNHDHNIVKKLERGKENEPVVRNRTSV
jgi:hypothetical protein